jgi:hypothetical protein
VKNTEIRIGNIINRNGLIVAVDEQTFWDMKKNPEQYNPILLTEEWLLNFGFIKNSTSWTNWQKPTGVKEVRVSIHNKYLFYNGRMIEFIHQLQNLYFALTGEELTTKN